MHDDARSIGQEVVAAFGGLTKAARALKHKSVTTVDGWQRSGRIPYWRYDEILTAAKSEDVALPARFLELVKARQVRNVVGRSKGAAA